jgi:hypothetical protein
MIISQRELKRHLKKWQPILRLKDWDIRLQMVPEKWRKFGDMKIDLDNRQAVLMVNRRPYTASDVDLEGLVVHELLHIKLHALGTMLEELLDAVYGNRRHDAKRGFAFTRYMLELESTVEDLTRSHLAAAGRRRPVSFGRIRREVEAELDDRAPAGGP